MSAPASIRSATGLFSGVVLLTALVVALSADGALSGNRGGFSPEIYVMNADGSGQANLTRNRAADDAPAWSRDGAKIALHTDRDGNYEIYVMNADGSGQANLTHEARTDDLGPAWSPDGTKIAFAGEGDIYVINPDGSGQTNLTRTLRSDDFEPAWSPDGTKIAFAGNLDTTAPLLALIARSPQRVLRQKGVIVSVLSNEACTLRALGTISVRGQRSKLRLRPASGRLGAPGQKKTLKLKLSSAGARQLTRLLAQGKRARATFSVRAVDRAGNARTERRTVAVGR